jgi:hypothetical protein
MDKHKDTGTREESRLPSRRRFLGFTGRSIVTGMGAVIALSATRTAMATTIYCDMSYCTEGYDPETHECPGTYCDIAYSYCDETCEVSSQSTCGSCECSCQAGSFTC